MRTVVRADWDAIPTALFVDAFKETDKLNRPASAYHEAGHAVIAYEMGWWVNHEGVEIDARQYCGICCYTHDYTTDNIVRINLAGWAAEFKWHGRGQLPDEDTLLELLTYVRSCHEDDRELYRDLYGDDFEALERLVSNGPNRSGAEVVTLYRQYQEEVMHRLQQPETWRKVEALVAALVRRGKLSMEEVEAVLLAIENDLSSNLQG